MADDEPIEKHADAGEVKFHGGCCEPVLQALNVCRDVHRLDIAQLPEALALAPVGEVRRGPGVGAPSIGIADVGGEELDEPPGGLRIGREECRQVFRRRRLDARQRNLLFGLQLAAPGFD
jgi:hypothetical protein